MCEHCEERARRDWEAQHAGDQKSDHRCFGPEARPEMRFEATELLAAPQPPAVNLQITVPPSEVPDAPPVQLFPTIQIPGLLEFLQGHLLLEKRVEMLEARLGELNI